MVGAFQEESVPGVQAGDASRAVAAESKTKNPERVYSGITRNVRITNRAEKGAMAGKPFIGTVDGLVYPEGAVFEDKDTWLKPGESILVPREAAIHLCGDCFSPNNAAIDGPEIIRRYGDFQFKAQNEDGTISGKNIQLIPVGPPRRFPDLVVQQVDSRGKEVGEAIAIFEYYGIDKMIRSKKNMNAVDHDDDE